MNYITSAGRFYLLPEKYNSGYLTGDIVIEKIGDNAFFLPFKDLECDAICPFKLRCYQDDSITPLESSNFALLEPENVILYPNPVHSGSGRLQVDGIQVDSWILHDLQGRVLYKQKQKFDGRLINNPWRSIVIGVRLLVELKAFLSGESANTFTSRSFTLFLLVRHLILNKKNSVKVNF